jgi:hypothetical protein
MRTQIFALMVGLSGCAKALPIPKQVPPSHVRPSWADLLTQHVDAMTACLELREAPRYVVFVEPLTSGASGVTTVDAFDAIEHCAYLDGRVVRRQPAEFRLRDVSEAQEALFSLGSAQPIVPAGATTEEVLERGQPFGWLYWPEPSAAGATVGAEEVAR